MSPAPGISASIMAAWLLAACGTPDNGDPKFPITLDDGGCVLERVASEEGVNHHQFDSLSPDGRAIAIGWNRGDTERGTFLLDLHTGLQTPIPEFNNGATFSPDGKYLLNSIYTDSGKTDIGLFERDSGKMTTIAPHEQGDWLPSFSPDGKKLVFNSFRSGNSDIYLFDSDDGTLTQLTESDNYEAHAQFAPDGNTIVFHERVSRTDFNLRVLDLRSGRVSSLGVDVTEESYPSWSPDGRYIAFASDRQQAPGVTDIFIMTSDGDLVRQVTRSTAKDAYPFWSPDGHYLYFTSYREPQGVYRTRMHRLIDCRTE